MQAHPIVVFCDGASKGNPGPGGWGAIIATPEGQVTELGGAAAHTTNNKMELTAAIEALAHVAAISGPVRMHTDSTYVIKGITEWIWGWRRRGWQTAEGAPVLNQGLWQQLDALASDRGKGLTWRHVKGHAGIPGNERVDEIADGLARGQRIDLYDGPLVGYGVAIFDLPEPSTTPKRSSERGPRAAKTPAYSYLSVVDGQAMRHATWAECEHRVKGRSGALFKKATSAEDEGNILRGWKVNLSRE